MDVTIFAWIFVIVFFLIYSTAQSKRCCLFFKKANFLNIPNESDTASQENATVDDGGRQQENTTQNRRANLSIRDRVLYNNHSDNITLVPNDDELKKNEGLPTYEEAVILDSNYNKISDKSNNSSASLKTTIITPPPIHSAPSSASNSSPSVVVNIEARIIPT